MFCQKCGIALGDVAAACPGCSTPVGGPVGVLAPAVPSGALVGALKSASKEAIGSLRSFAADPVGRLAPTCESLGEAGARRVGIAFGVSATAGFLLGGYLTLPEFLRRDVFDFLGFGGVLEAIGFAVVPFACAVAGGHAMRRILGGRGTLGGDLFIGGAAVLPSAAAMIVNGILGLENAKLVLAVSVLAGCTSILMLYAGFTRISKLTDRAATLTVPTVVLLGLWLANTLAASILEGPGPSGPPPEFLWR